MLDAAEDAAGLQDDTLWLKWPNDIVAVAQDGLLRKVAGVLGESTSGGDGDRLETAVVGIGINADWEARDFPPDLAPMMTSLREVANGRPVDREQLLDGYLARLEPRYEALASGTFDAGGWTRRQRTTGSDVEVLVGDVLVYGRATGVDPGSGALLVRTPDADVAIDSGEVTRCRILTLPTRR
jgi:BirA family biotin operon repressor/biotin-[acetyl-CoA-carboxylase] ligase